MNAQSVTAASMTTFHEKGRIAESLRNNIQKIQRKKTAVIWESLKKIKW